MCEVTDSVKFPLHELNFNLWDSYSASGYSWRQSNPPRQGLSIQSTEAHFLKLDAAESTASLHLIQSTYLPYSTMWHTYAHRKVRRSSNSPHHTTYIHMYEHTTYSTYVQSDTSICLHFGMYKTCYSALCTNVGTYRGTVHCRPLRDTRLRSSLHSHWQMLDTQEVAEKSQFQ